MKKITSRKRKYVAAGILLVAVLAGASWLFFGRQHPDSVPVVVTEVDAALADLEKQIPAQFSDYEVRRSGWTGQRDTGNGRGADGYDFMVSSAADPGIVISPHHANDEIIPPTHTSGEVIAYLKQTLVASGFAVGQDFGEPDSAKTALAKGDATCLIEEIPSYSAVQFTCHGPKIEQALAAQAKPFAKAYLKAHHGLKAASLVYGPMVIRSQNPDGPIGKSHVAGYDLAEAVVAHGNDSSIALFYSKQGVWHYITESTDEYGFSCSDIMKDPDARKAYRHYWCYQREGDQGLRILDYDVK